MIYQVVHSSPEIRTIGEYCSEIDSPGFKFLGQESLFLNVKNERGTSNLDNILSSYNPKELVENRDLIASKKLLKTGTILYIPAEKIEVSSLLTQGVEVVSNSYSAFKSSVLTQLENDKGYEQIIKPLRGHYLNGTVKQSFPLVSVWVWVRSLSGTYNSTGQYIDESEGSLIDITPFIQKLTTSTSKNGGNFSIVLPPLTCEIVPVVDSNGKVNSTYKVKRGSLKRSTVNGKENILYQDNVFQRPLENNNSGDDSVFITPQRSNFYFHNVLSTNDIVFIRFESLQSDYSQRIEETEPSYNELAGKIYDMIGLIDTNNIEVSGNGTDVSISISGRDFSKLFIEDGAYFYNLENITGQFRVAGESTRENQLMRRIVGDNSLYYLSLYQNTSIEKVLKFVIQQLSTIGVCGDSVFKSWGDRRNKKFIENTEHKFDERLARGVWQIVKLVVDDEVTRRRIVDSSISSANGSLLNFIRKVCQEPFVEFMMDTYGDTFNLVVRKPPFDEKSIVSYLKGPIRTEDGSYKSSIVTITADDTLKEELSFNDTEAYSWYSFKPQNMHVGGGDLVPTAYVPAIYFEEYAKIWGSKPLELVHNYNPYYSSVSENGVSDISKFQTQSILDLKYIIETHAYLPFTRKGTLVINGDRRIKKGNFIRYQTTGEVFYVDGVQHSFSVTDKGVDRTTTIQVSRGMVESLIYGISYEDGKEFSYFNIIDTDFQIKTKEYSRITSSEVEVEKKRTTLVNRSEVDKYNKQVSIQPGFNEYLQHQQGLQGAKLIVNAAKTNQTTIRSDVELNMRSNIGIDFKEKLSPLNFLLYWVKKWNTAYQFSNIHTSFDDEYKKISSLLSIPIEILKTFGYIESRHTNDDSTGLYRGIIQVSEREGLQFSVSDISTPYNNILVGGKIYKRNILTKIIGSTFSYSDSVDDEKVENEETYTEIESKDSTESWIGIDEELIYSKLKVNKDVFNFFLRKEQFAWSSSVTQTQLKNSKILDDEKYKSI